MILNELGIKYDTIMVDVFESGSNDAKIMWKSDYIAKINPNGRIPAIVDHTANDFILWESVAIIQYITKKFDTEYKLTYNDFQKEALVNQYLLYQAFGQGRKLYSSIHLLVGFLLFVERLTYWV